MEPVAESSSRSHRSYTRAFKLHVVAEYFHSDESYREVAQRNHISSANTVRHWCSQYHRVIEDADMMRANQEGNAALDAAHLSDAELQLVACEAMKMSVYNLSRQCLQQFIAFGQMESPTEASPSAISQLWRCSARSKDIESINGIFKTYLVFDRLMTCELNNVLLDPSQEKLRFEWELDNWSHHIWEDDEDESESDEPDASPEQAAEQDGEREGEPSEPDERSCDE